MTLIKKRELYKAFGFRINSQIEMPELIKLDENENLEEIVIEYGDLTQLWANVGEKGKFIVTEKMVLFRIENTAIFCIKDGNKIIVTPLCEGNNDKMRLFILGTCMGSILMQKNIYPLHGSAIEINGKAYAFIGDSGAGKSTLARAFLHRGYRLLSDDVIAVTFSDENQNPFVISSYPQQKLWEESLYNFEMNRNNYNPLFERETKYAVPVRTQFLDNHLPLSGIFEVAKSDMNEITLQHTNPLEGIHTLYRNTYRNMLIPRMGLLDWHFKNSVNILNRTKLFEIKRPSSRFTANELVEIVLETIN